MVGVRSHPAATPGLDGQTERASSLLVDLLIRSRNFAATTALTETCNRWKIERFESFRSVLRDGETPHFA